MKERPILFSGPMVRAILDGTKTQTRRVFKQATGPSLSVGMDENTPGVAELSWLYGDGPGHEVYETVKRVTCPYGQPGDRLWVRENFFQRGRWGLPEHPEAEEEDRYWIGSKEIAYAADVKRPGHDWRSRPSIHMPRHASRITLEITSVRVERLQSISEADALAEGVKHSLHLQCGRLASENFAHLWWTINGDGSWEKNPWVWVVEFKRVKP